MNQKSKQAKARSEEDSEVIDILDDVVDGELSKHNGQDGANVNSDADVNIDVGDGKAWSDESVSGEFEDESRESLIEKLLASQEFAEEMKDGYIRAKADVENIQRRSQNEIITARKYAIEGFARELLSVIDSLDQASKVELDKVDDEAVVKMKEGLELTLKQLDKVMEKFGVCQIEAEHGLKFNPDIHQAINMVASDELESDHIVSVMQKGYTLKDRLLRPAMVSIAT